MIAEILRVATNCERLIQPGKYTNKTRKFRTGIDKTLNKHTLFQLDRQNKKIAELEETVRKLESLKTIAESQNLELLRKLKDAEKVVRGPVKKGIPKHDDSKDSPHVSLVGNGL